MEFEEFKLNVANNIRELRNRLGLTQENMADYGFDVRHYQNIEAGRVNLSLETIHRLANVFKCKYREILD